MSNPPAPITKVKPKDIIVSMLICLKSISKLLTVKKFFVAKEKIINITNAPSTVPYFLMKFKRFAFFVLI